MPDVSSPTPGTHCWVDLATSDVDASVAFYGGLFGWEHQLAGPPEQAGGYGFYMKGSKMAAGVGPKQNEQQPVAWSTYVCSDDAKRTAEKVRTAGGQVLLEPFAVMEAGFLGVFADSAGAVFGVWQPGRHPGVEIAGEPGAMVWNELQTRDADGAKRFYGDVFGWEADTHEARTGAPYTEWKLNGTSIGGMIQMGEGFPPDLPSNWLVYFGAQDTGAAAARVSELGGNVLVPPTSLPAGTFAVAQDPQSAVFGLLQVARS